MNLLNELDALLDRFIARLRSDRVIGTLVDGSITREHLVFVYTQIWHCIHETPRSSAAAARTIELYAGDDPRFQGEPFARFKSQDYAAMAGMLKQQVRQEGGHDTWILADLVALGVPADEVKRSQPGPSIAAYLGVLRQTVVGPTPIGKWGQAYLLEGIGPTVWHDAVKHTLSRSTIPNIANAMKCLAGHAESDVDHLASARRYLGNVGDARDQEAILYNARVTLETWSGIGHDALAASRPGPA
jgi:hypothetical protein